MVVNPNTTAKMTDAVVAAAGRVAQTNTLVVGATSDSGVDAVESNVDEVRGAAAVLELVAAGSAVDAFVIACFGDTGVAAARELANVPAEGLLAQGLSTSRASTYAPTPGRPAR